MKILFIVAMFLFLAGCYHQQKTSEIGVTTSNPGNIAFATLSDSGDAADMSASVVYTKLGVFRYRIAHALRRGVISVQQAEDWQYVADTLRHKLELARSDRKMASIQVVSGELDYEMNELERLYEAH